ncbi:chorismate mutase [Bacillus sp. FJAT-44742]|uniref:chorismate mutase n=1 Tax=Bacillus sp. FJAT-44742 TaxID=2014005 RepID=UPI000C23BA4D|nr:chorismate mutase [Bacillus sp. FJAT-44742]
MIRGIRGAITVENNQSEDILQATTSLLQQMIDKNGINAEQVAHIWFTVTKDLDTAFPAKVTRSFEGWQYVPVMCATEIPVPGSLEKCIRIMVTVDTAKAQEEINHVYLGGASVLRPDLGLTNSQDAR